MGITFVCDGCSAVLEEATKVGWYDLVYYGECCLPTWNALAQEREVIRIEAVRFFEEKWALAQGRSALKKLPDGGHADTAHRT